MNPLQLQIGDRLYSEGGWNVIWINIIQVTEAYAIGENGIRFKRDFKDGDSPIRTIGGVSLDFNNWYREKLSH